jgi:hypothetical protein
VAGPRQTDSRTIPHANKRFWLIENLHHGDELAALDHEIDAAPFVRLIERAGAELRAIQLAADCEQAVADDLRFEPTGSESP